jgi:NAD+ kinase
MGPDMSTIALVIHQDRPEALEVALETIQWLESLSHRVVLPVVEADRLDRGDLGVADDDLGRDASVAVSLGGDGTMLRTVAMVAQHDVPVIGVNFGQLGYLTDVEPDGVRQALEAFLGARYTLEERMLLEVEIHRAGIGSTTVLALNEAVVEKTASGNTVRLDVELDGTFFTPYAADGLIVATPTGSTAYAFSARGPIVEPTHRALLLTPVSPHMLFDRTLVLDDDSQVRLTVTDHRPAALVIDGRPMGDLRPGDHVTCRAATTVARLVMFGPRDFHAILKAKFGLADR